MKREGGPDTEVVLTGGRLTPGVVRIGDTVRRPTGEHSPFVHRLLGVLEARGVSSAPRFLGLDDDGREILTYHDGWVPPNLEGRRWSNAQISAAAQIVRDLHDATVGSALVGQAEVACHGDLSPCNFVFVEETPSFLIDFDRAHPGSRKRDLAYMAWLWLIGVEDETEAPPLQSRLEQLPVLLGSYQLDDRADFAEAIEAEQREILAEATTRDHEDGMNWVKNEIAFVRSRADLINLAALADR